MLTAKKQQDNLSENEIREAHEIAGQVKSGIDWALKVAYGEAPRPKKTLCESMLELKKEVEEENKVNG